MKGVIFNFGKPGVLRSPTEYQVRYIKENYLQSFGITTHYDPDLIYWLFGDYPTKASKTRLQNLEPAMSSKSGDCLFFTTTLKTEVKTQYFIAVMVIKFKLNLMELIEFVGNDELATTPPYCYHPHVQHYLHETFKEHACIFFVGDPTESFVLKEPLALNRDMIKELYQKFPAQRYQDSKLYNWYYNDLEFPNQFGVKRDKRGHILSDATLIGSKFRNVPLIPPELTKWLFNKLKRRQRLSSEDYAYYGIRHGPKIP